MATVIELHNPKALLAPEVEKVLRAAVEAVPFAAPGGFDTIAADLFRWVQSDNFFILIGFEDGEAKGTVWGFFPADRVFPYPTVTMLYSKGSTELRKALAEKLLETLLSRGYTKAWAVNATGRGNAAWQRLFRLAGKTKADVLGSVMELTSVA
jgi:hypothetical protein